jgi:hypothetical protein
MKFCPVVPEICCGQVHGPQKERKKEKEKNNNNNKKRSKTVCPMVQLLSRFFVGNQYKTEASCKINN